MCLSQFARLLKPKPGNNSGSGAPIPSATYAILPASPGKGETASTPPSGMTTRPRREVQPPKKCCGGAGVGISRCSGTKDNRVRGRSLPLVRDCQIAREGISTGGKGRSYAMCSNSSALLLSMNRTRRGSPLAFDHELFGCSGRHHALAVCWRFRGTIVSWQTRCNGVSPLSFFVFGLAP